MSNRAREKRGLIVPKAMGAHFYRFLRRALRPAGISAALLLVSAIACARSSAPAAGPPEATEAAPIRYRIDWKLDFEHRSYTGVERVVWTNQGDHAASTLYFHLYANLHSSNSPTSDDSRLEVREVRDGATKAPLTFNLDEQSTTMRVSLRAPVAPGKSTEVELKFAGSVPEADAETTSLFAHVVQQVGAVLKSAREMRQASDVNFSCRGVMLLGTAYPVLAARDGDDWQRRVEVTVGDMVLTDVADYRVSVETSSNIALYTSGEAAEAGPKTTPEGAIVREFSGHMLRDFALVAGPALRSEERQIGEMTIRTVFAPEQEAIGRRVLNIATEAVRIYVARFGPLPTRTINIVETPLVAGVGSAEFAGLGAIASAFYVDFDSPKIRNLPEIIREQRASIEESLEWTVAHVVAHQWWGSAVGNDPSREPVLDEALANWSALLYYREARGEERAALALDDQLRGVYKIYRTFGGEDMAADRPARDYRNFFQYAAIVSSKGALMFAALRQLMGDEKYFSALRSYYHTNRFEIAEMNDLRGAFIAEAPLAQRRAVDRIFNRWLSGKHGDEDIAPPDLKLAASLGINPVPPRNGDRNAFARLGKFFWQQMTRIR